MCIRDRATTVCSYICSSLQYRFFVLLLSMVRFRPNRDCMSDYNTTNNTWYVANVQSTVRCMLNSSSGNSSPLLCLCQHPFGIPFQEAILCSKRPARKFTEDGWYLCSRLRKRCATIINANADPSFVFQDREPSTDRIGTYDLSIVTL